VVDQNTGIGTLVFHIDRGSQVEVARVLFANLPDSVVAYFLRQQLANKPGEPYEAEMVKWDAGTVAQWVRDRGYLDGVVATSRVEFFDKVETWEDRSRHGPRLIPEGKRDDRVVVTHFIEPGKRYRLGSVRFVHNAEVVSEEELRSAFGLKDGVLYQRRVIELAIERCRYLLANQGYARASVVQDAVRDPETGTVDLTLRVVEGTIYTVGRIDPDGNTITKDRIVRRSMNLDPGDLYNETAVENSKEQLRRTGIFKDDPQFPLKIEKYYPDDRPDEVDLRVKLAEEDTGSFSVTAGWSSSSGFSVGLRYTEKNFDLIGAVWDRENWRGAGQILNASANLDSDNTSLSLSWTEPRVMDGPYFLSLAFARNETTALDWDEVRVTWSATVGRYFFNYALLLQAQYSYTDLVTKNGQLDAANDTWIRVPANYHMNTVTLTQTWDKRNRANLTTSGYRITLQESITGGLLSASHPYLELSANIEGWIPLFESDLGGTTFLYLRQKFGYARGLTGENYVPFYDRFYGGGPFPRHRGWEQNEQGPREENNFGLQSRPGGTREWLTTIQINVPVDGTQQGIRAVAFADIGNIWGPDEGFSLSQLVVAAGVGLRLPVALPIAFDFAWVLNPEEGQPGSQFHFGITGGF
jgi:outer membrane protein insertion porin family